MTIALPSHTQDQAARVIPILVGGLAMIIATGRYIVPGERVQFGRMVAALLLMRPRL